MGHDGTHTRHAVPHPAGRGAHTPGPGPPQGGSHYCSSAWRRLRATRGDAASGDAASADHTRAVATSGAHVGHAVAQRGSAVAEPAATPAAASDPVEPSLGYR